MCQEHAHIECGCAAETVGWVGQLCAQETLLEAAGMWSRGRSASLPFCASFFSQWLLWLTGQHFICSAEVHILQKVSGQKSP